MQLTVSQNISSTAQRTNYKLSETCNFPYLIRDDLEGTCFELTLQEVPKLPAGGTVCLPHTKEMNVSNITFFEEKVVAPVLVT
jgi:hypothetical protein